MYQRILKLGGNFKEKQDLQSLKESLPLLRNTYQLQSNFEVEKPGIHQ